MTKRTCCYCDAATARPLAVGYSLANWPDEPPATLYACPDCYAAYGIPKRDEDETHREETPAPIEGATPAISPTVDYTQPTLFTLTETSP